MNEVAQRFEAAAQSTCYLQRPRWCTMPSSVRVQLANAVRDLAAANAQLAAARQALVINDQSEGGARRFLRLLETSGRGVRFPQTRMIILLNLIDAPIGLERDTVLGGSRGIRTTIPDESGTGCGVDDGGGALVMGGRKKAIEFLFQII